MDGRVDRNLHWLWEPRYDTFLMPGRGVDKATFFQVPLRVVGSGFGIEKTKAETNMTNGGQLGCPNQFQLYGFAAAVPESTSPADRDAIRRGVFNFTSDICRIWFAAPMVIIPMHPSEKSELFDKDDKIKNKRIKEIPYKTGLYYLAPETERPLLLEGAHSFRVEISYPNGPAPLPSGNDCRINIFLVGLYGSCL